MYHLHQNAIITGGTWAYERALQLHAYVQRKMGYEEEGELMGCIAVDVMRV